MRATIGNSSERGLATTEVAFLTPLLLLLIVGIAQAALWAHASAVAQAAADFGADVGATFGAAPDDGTAAAKSFVVQSGGLNNVTAAVSSAGGSITITVSGDVPSVVGSLSIRASSTSAIEMIPQP